MHIRCIYLWSTPLDPDACMYDSRFYEAHVLDEDECMYTCMMHKSISGQINKPILGVCVYDAYIYDLWSLILTCVYDACINVCKLWCIYLLSLILIHVCMMCTHVCTMYTYDVRIVYGTHIYDPGLWSWYMHVWCTYLRSLILIHVCIMQVCMMNFDPQSLVLMHVWCMNVWYTYLWSWCMHVSMMRQILSRTNEPTDKAILGVGYK